MFTLDEIVPWGRSFDEYRRMFALTDADLEMSIVGCGDGPAGFNAEATRRGTRVVSCDPLYRSIKADIEHRIASTYANVLEQTKRSAAQFVWDDVIDSVDTLGRVRMDAMQAFLDDFDTGKANGRYIDAALPVLPFSQGTFDLALCSHFLFLYTDQLDERFHHAAIQEMCRVAAEVRIFPLLALNGQPSPYVESLTTRLLETGNHVTIERVRTNSNVGAIR